MEYKDSLKKILLVLLGIVVLAFVASWVISKRSAQNKNDKKTVDTAIYKTNVDPSQAPAKFPSNVPIEAGAKIVQNYNANTADGRFQATRVFETSKSLAENFKIYGDFAKADGWETRSQIDQPTYKMLLFHKGNADLQVSIDENQSTKIKTVNISYTEITTPKK